MRVQITPFTVKLWLSANDTRDWAYKPGASWPCSELSGHRLFAEFDRGGLIDVAIDGGRGEQDVSGDEFNAITSDYLRGKVPENHPAFFCAVGQFRK